MSNYSNPDTELVHLIEPWRQPYSPPARITRAKILQDDRRVEYIYDVWEGELHVHAWYFLDGERVAEEEGGTYPLDLDEGVVYHTEDGQDLHEFIKANAFADPEISLTDEFESMVKVSATEA